MVVVSDRVPSLTPVDNLPPPTDTFDVQLLEALRAIGRGHFDVRLATHEPGPAAEIAAAVNDLAELNQRTEHELRRIRRIVGQAGRIRERVPIEGLEGDWARQMRSVNQLIGDVATPAAEVTRVLDAVARGNSASG